MAGGLIQAATASCSLRPAGAVFLLLQHFFGHVVAASGASAAGPAGIALLQGLVIFGALLYVFGRGAKFSLFKPAEEMVYITLDEDGRTRGKAAIDVVGSQVGGCGWCFDTSVLLTRPCVCVWLLIHIVCSLRGGKEVLWGLPVGSQGMLGAPAFKLLHAN